MREKPSFGRPKELIKAEIKQALKRLGVDGRLEFSLSLPTKAGFGDLTSNVALIGFQKYRFKLSGRFSSPFDLAQELASDLNQKLVIGVKTPFLAKVEAAGAGFLNFYFSEQFLWQESLGFINQKTISRKIKLDRSQKVMVEFTDPNPFKELHIGHVYSNTVGETISRGYEALGYEVKRACYQGDVGMHVAKTLWGWLKLGQSLAKLDKQPLGQRVAFLGQAYALGATVYKEDKRTQAQIKQLNYLVFVAAQDRLKEETGWQPKVNYRQYLDKVQEFDYQQVKELYFAGRSWSLEAFEEQYRRLGTKFDYYFFESQVGEVGYEIVKRFLVQSIFEESKGAVIFPGEKYGLHNRVFINSLGLPTYEAKELGLAPTKYRQFAYDQSIIVTANEVDDYFKVLLKAMELTLPDLAKKTKHISHGMVKLTTGKMSSRTGQVVKAKDLLDQVEELVQETLNQRQGLSAVEKRQIAGKLATAAVKYVFLRSAIGADIVFDPKKAVTLNGESGPYLIYSYVRTQSVWRRLQSKFGLNKELVIDTLLSSKDDLSKLGGDNVESKELDILRKLNQYFDVVVQSVYETKPHLLANYLFDLAQSFSRFYESVPILSKLKIKSGKLKLKDLPRKTQRRLLITEMTGQVLKHGLWVLGIETVEKM